MKNQLQRVFVFLAIALMLLACTNDESKSVAQPTLSPGLPTITTNAITSFSDSSAQSGGNITSDGGSSITSFGVCWSTSTNPTVTLSTKTMDGYNWKSGIFTSYIMGLTANTTYYLRAYATNAIGTAYGNEVSFVTAAGCGNVTDIDGNVYPTIIIGNQCWMQKNLDVSHYQNGDVIPQVTDPIAWSNLTTGAWCYYENKTENGTVYGKLYNWYAITDPRGLAPVSWEVPSDGSYYLLPSEWFDLFNYLGGYYAAGGKLKATTGWDSPNAGATNSSGFTGLPGGFRDALGHFTNIGKEGWWWSTGHEGKSIDPPFVYHGLNYNSSCCVYGTPVDKQSGFSVRCVRYK